MSLRIVLDINIRFSGLLYGGTPRRLIQALKSSEFTQLISQSLLDEFRSVLERKAPWTSQRIQSEITNTTQACEQVQPNLSIKVCRDPNDNHILECAVAGDADLIVSGDHDLLVLNPFENIPFSRRANCSISLNPLSPDPVSTAALATIRPE